MIAAITVLDVLVLVSLQDVTLISFIPTWPPTRRSDGRKLNRPMPKARRREGPWFRTVKISGPSKIQVRFGAEKTSSLL